MMNIRTLIKQFLPSYLVEKHLVQRLDKIDKRIRETNEKNDYLFWLSQMQPGESLQQTKERVFLQMPKATGRLRNIQLAENYILRRVKEVCDQNGMELFLVGGTLMGAVRHKGFIPWDNDIDIGMMKEDYLKLRKLLENDPEIVAQYCYHYREGLKISKVKFRAVEVFWIDILVFDYIDVTPETLEQVWKDTQTANQEHVKQIKELSRPYVNEQGCRPQPNAVLDQQLAEFEEQQMKCFPNFGHGDYFCEPINCPWWSRDERGIRKVSDYYPLLKDEVEFEGHRYSVWKHYKSALKLSYGEYWNLPFSIREPHTTEFDEGLEAGFTYLRKLGIIEAENVCD